MRYVIKIGTSSLFNEDGTAKEYVLKSALETIKEIFSEENEVVLVVSGAVACGKAMIKQIVEKIEKEYLIFLITLQISIVKRIY